MKKQRDYNKLGRWRRLAAYTGFFSLGVIATLAFQISYRSPESPGAAATSSVKPWGQIVLEPMPFLDSEKLFPDRSERLKKPVWVFENYSPEQLSGLFQSCRLRGAQRSELLNTNRWQIRDNGCWVAPSEELVLGLSQSARAQIYSILARCPSNYVQRYAFRFANGEFNERFAQSGLSRKKIEMIRGLTYTNLGLLSFCDLEPLQRSFAAAEFEALVKVLYSTPTVCMGVRVPRSCDINTVTDYWGRGGRSKRIRPILESLASDQGAVNVSFMMPAFARLRLYTYPDPVQNPNEGREDCFFTALNFFNEQPDLRFLDTQNTRRALQSEYHIVEGEPVFGDLIVLANPAGDALHVAVYIAENVVFTKNGSNPLQPWVLMKIPDMLTFFPSEQTLSTVVLRRNNLNS